MTIAETSHSTSVPNKPRTERSKNPAQESSRSSDVKHGDALNFLQELNNIENVLPQMFLPVTAINSSEDIRMDTSPGSQGVTSGMFSQATEDPNAAFLSNTIIQKMLRDPSLQNMSFSIQNKHGHVNVEAAITNGHMRCTLATASEKLRRRLNDARHQIISRLSNHLRMQVELDIGE